MDEAAVQWVARALARLAIQRARRWQKPAITEDDIAKGVEYCWGDYREEAIAAIQAMQDYEPERPADIPMSAD